MSTSVAVIGAGVSGLTCGVVLAERGYGTAIFAEEMGQATTSAAAAAMWYPYDAEPADAVIVWALATYEVLVGLGRNPETGVSMIELRNFSRRGEIEIPQWAHALGGQKLVRPREGEGLPPGPETSLMLPSAFSSGFALSVPLTDTTIYLDYLAKRFLAAGGAIHPVEPFAKCEEIDCRFDLVIDCAGIGARSLVGDLDLEPHRGQVAIVPRLDLPGAIVCDDAPLMYVIPRRDSCVFGGTNEVSDERRIDPAATSRIVAECSRVLNISQPKVIAERVGLRPFRKKGVRVEVDRLIDGRTVIHNYGHGGSGFTLSWGCAARVLDLAASNR